MSTEVRFATADDAATLHRFIVALAEYEREPDAVETTPEQLAEQLRSERPPFECLIADCDGAPAGFALFFSTYSTWRGKPGIHLEDLFVLPEFRGRGLGTRLLGELARLTVERGCARLEWWVLDWNESAIGFYESLGAHGLDGWNVFRLTDEPLADLAQSTTEKS